MADRVQHQVHGLARSGFAGDDTVIIQIPNHGQIEDILACVHVRNIRYPLLIHFVCINEPLI